MAIRMPRVLLCVGALAGSLLLLGSMNMHPTSAPALRGERRLSPYQVAPDSPTQMPIYPTKRDHIRWRLSSFFESIGDFCSSFFDHLFSAFTNIARALRRFCYDPLGSIETLLGYCPWALLTSWMPESWQFLLFMSQVIFAVAYYFMVVSYYPYWYGPTPMSAHIQSEIPPVAAMHATPSNLFLSFCCPQSRAAHTFDKTGIMDYWCGVVAMFCCPFCTLCWANSCTDLNPKLGGWPANPLSSFFFTWCCAPCVIAQDAQSLDACTGACTEPCGVSYPQGPPCYEPYPPVTGGGLPPMASPYGPPMGGMSRPMY